MPKVVGGPPKVSSTKGKKIQKVTNALRKGASCATCRRRKVRCSGEKPACRACLRTAAFENRPLDEVFCDYAQGAKFAERRKKKEEQAERGQWRVTDNVLKQEEQEIKAEQQFPLIPDPYARAQSHHETHYCDNPTPYYMTHGVPPRTYTPTPDLSCADSPSPEELGYNSYPATDEGGTSSAPLPVFDHAQVEPCGSRDGWAEPPLASPMAREFAHVRPRTYPSTSSHSHQVEHYVEAVGEPPSHFERGENRANHSLPPIVDHSHEPDYPQYPHYSAPRRAAFLEALPPMLQRPPPHHSYVLERGDPSAHFARPRPRHEAPSPYHSPAPSPYHHSHHQVMEDYPPRPSSAAAYARPLPPIPYGRFDEEDHEGFHHPPPTPVEPAYHDDYDERRYHHLSMQNNDAPPMQLSMPSPTSEYHHYNGPRMLAASGHDGINSWTRGVNHA